MTGTGREAVWLLAGGMEKVGEKGSCCRSGGVSSGGAAVDQERCSC